MKKIVFLLVAVCIGSSVLAQETVTVKEVKSDTKVVAKENKNPDAAIFKFEKETIDYGTIEKGSDGNRVFKFKNIGKSPLIITRVKASCGCTVPSHPKEPIMPGATAEIKVKYDTNRASPFNKAITIYSNASEATKVIYIKGNVKKVSALTLLERKEKSMLENKKNN